MIVPRVEWDTEKRGRDGFSRNRARARGAEVLTRRLDGALLALFADKWRLNAILRDNPSLRLDPLLAGTVV